jgi:hypothetical protein
MASPQRVNGLPTGHMDGANHEIFFELSTPQGHKLPFVAKFGVASQIVSSLARMVRQMEGIMRSQNVAASTAVEMVAEAHVQKERWQDLVILRFVSAGGVPYTFGIPSAEAAQLAEMLKTESAKPTQTGNA